MSFLTLLPDKRELIIAAGETILAGALRQGIPLVHAWGGLDQCSTYRAQVLAGIESCSPPNASEQKLTILPNRSPPCAWRARLGPRTICALDDPA